MNHNGFMEEKAQQEKNMTQHHEITRFPKGKTTKPDAKAGQQQQTIAPSAFSKVYWTCQK